MLSLNMKVALKYAVHGLTVNHVAQNVVYSHQ